ncbi:unannotated protein [freshwater metagenome]|uniref:Unannotated protein n=1 Tax=freshwater metagenome TaxID=449393 RepID=A0A6J6I7R2_9ZZZZ
MNARRRVCILQVVNQLLEVFNGIDVVVRRRTNESDARSGVTSLCNPWIHLVSGKLSTFAWLCTLGHLDLNVISVHQVFTGHTEATRSHLLDCRTLGVTVCHGRETLGVFAAFTGVALCTHSVHCDCQVLMCFCGNRAVTHCTRRETLHDFRNGLHFINGDGGTHACTQFKKSAQCCKTL